MVTNGDDVLMRWCELKKMAEVSTNERVVQVRKKVMKENYRWHITFCRRR